MKSKVPLRIGIVGVGLIGGSICMGLKQHLGKKITIFGSCHDTQRTHQALQLGIIDHVFTSVIDILKDIDCLILCAPTSKNIDELHHLRERDGILTFDVSSTKREICKEAERLHVRFIGTHPMAGGELSGFEHATPYLFVNKPWVICPSKTALPHDDAVIQEIIRLLGAHSVIMSPQMHDRDIAAISHIPLLLSSILVRVASRGNWNMRRKLASTGFKDSTRLASHDCRIKTDIVFSNKENILHNITMLEHEFKQIRSLLKINKRDELQKYFQDTKSIRDAWLKKDFN